MLFEDNNTIPLCTIGSSIIYIRILFLIFLWDVIGKEIFSRNIFMGGYLNGVLRKGNNVFKMHVKKTLQTSSCFISRITQSKLVGRTKIYARFAINSKCFISALNSYFWISSVL